MYQPDHDSIVSRNILKDFYIKYKIKRFVWLVRPYYWIL